MPSVHEKYAWIEFANQEEWRVWLSINHAALPGVWLIYRRAAHGGLLRHSAIVDEALCFGWIDGQSGRADEERSRILVTPRRAGSGWSKVNKNKIKQLMATGKMQPAGFAVIERAKVDGSWELLDQVEAMVIPADFAIALAVIPGARQNFDSYAPSVRKQFLYRINSAKRPETRAARIAMLVAAAAEKRNPFTWVPKEKRPTS